MDTWPELAVGAAEPTKVISSNVYNKAQIATQWYNMSLQKNSFKNVDSNSKRVR